MKNPYRLICLLSVFVLASCDYVFPSTWNYRITVEIETPEGIKTGSTVRQVRAWRNPAQLLNPDIRNTTYRVIGEAVVIDLGERGILFSLNDWDSNALISNAFPPTETDGANKYGIFKTSGDSLKYYQNLESGKKVVQTGWKSFVWLDRLDDSKNVQRLDSKDFQTILGDGFKLKQTTIEVTDDPVTWQIYQLLTKIESKFGAYRRASFQNKK